MGAVCAGAVMLAPAVGTRADDPLAKPAAKVEVKPAGTVDLTSQDSGAVADRLLSTSETPAEAAFAWLAERGAGAPGGESPEERMRKVMEEATAHSQGITPADLHVYDKAGSTWTVLLPNDPAKLPLHVVLLVGGLDEPATIFDTAAPALAETLANSIGPARVVRITFASDLSLASCGWKLRYALEEELSKRGVKRVDFVGHSSGGLVIRDVLTRTGIYNSGREYAEGSSQYGFPRVGSVTLIATPNRGSWLAPLRIARTTRDNFVRWIDSDGRDRAAFAAFIHAGSSEVIRDLVPGSAYLTELSGRQSPRWASGRTDGDQTHIPLTVVAGTLAGGSALEGVDLKAMMTWPIVRQAFNPDQIEKAQAAIDELGRIVSDGLVPVSSAELEGADDVVYVEANHRSVLRPWVQGEAEQPAAVRVMVERLRK